jgi:uncharacterized repeat protein (TIGR01451 family)
LFVWEFGSLLPGQEKRIRLEMVAKMRGTLDCQATVTFTGSSRLCVHVHEPKIQLTARGTDKAVLGDQVPVILTVCNQGDGTAEQIKVKTVLPEGLTHLHGQVVETEVGRLGPLETRTIQVTCTATKEGPQSCEAVVCADGALLAPTTVRIDVVQPRLQLTAEGPKLRYLERHAVYSYKLSNAGSGTATQVKVTEQLPRGFQFLAASSGGHYDVASRTVSWFVGDLRTGQDRELRVEAIAVAAGEHKHQVVAQAARGLRAQAELVTRVESQSALLMELVDLDDPVEVGTDTSYEIRVTNTGSKTETNLQLTCTLPEKMEFRGAKGAGDCHFHVEGREIRFEPLPRLAPRADAIYRVHVRGLAPGDVRFRAVIRADGLSQPVLREESTRVYGD